MMGMTAQYLREARRGMAAVDQRICYRREALVGDVIVVRSAMLEVQPKSVRFVHEMFRGDGGDHLSTMLVTGVHIDIAARRSTPFDPQIASKSQSMIAADPTLWDAWPPNRAFLAAGRD
jgi:acyl-CoA thioester hydrolase